MFFLFLLCIGLGVAVEATYKTTLHPQTAYCTANFVVKVTIRSALTTPTATTTQSYKQFNILIDHVYKGQTWVDKLTNKGLLYFTTDFATTYPATQDATRYPTTQSGTMYPEVGKTYLMTGNVYEGKFYATYYNILETITDASVETMFTKRFQAYDCSCGIDTGLYPGKLTTTTIMCVNPSPCQSYDYCHKENGKCTWKCF